MTQLLVAHVKLKMILKLIQKFNPGVNSPWRRHHHVNVSRNVGRQALRCEVPRPGRTKTSKKIVCEESNVTGQVAPLMVRVLEVLNSILGLNTSCFEWSVLRLRSMRQIPAAASCRTTLTVLQLRRFTPFHILLLEPRRIFDCNTWRYVHASVPPF